MTDNNENNLHPYNYFWLSKAFSINFLIQFTLNVSFVYVVSLVPFVTFLVNFFPLRYN